MARRMDHHHGLRFFNDEDICPECSLPPDECDCEPEEDEEDEEELDEDFED